MAGDWIKMRTSLDTDPDVVRISSGLNLDRFAVVGRLHKVWSWANEHSIDGQDVPVDSAFLDGLTATPGFAEQLRHVGWLSGRDGNLCFPNFLRHNGESAKQRAQDALRKQYARKRNAGQTPKTSAICPVENRTETGPEKRREEKRRKEEPPNPPANSTEEKAVELAQRFWFVQTGGKEDEFKIASAIQSMLDFGYSPESILLEVEKSPKERDRSERFWKVKDRLEKAGVGRVKTTAEAVRETKERVARARGETV